MPSPRLLIQTTTGEKYVWDAELARNPDMREYIGESDERGCHTYMAEIPKIDSDVVSFHLSASGIGDSVCAIYAACGLVNAGHQVEYHAKNTAWLIGISYPGLQIIPEDKTPFDANANYPRQIKEAFYGTVESRPGWYIRNIATAYGIEECKPSRPNVVKPYPVTDGKYVVLAPFSSHDSRDWHFNHYRRLAINLQRQGIRVISIGSPKQKERLDSAFYGLNLEKIAGQPPHWVSALVANAAVVVGNDSGIVHLGGLYETPTFCIHSQFDSAYSFMCGDSIECITPDMSCARCHGLAGGGWDQNCNWVCSALQTINPELVTKKVMQKYEAS